MRYQVFLSVVVIVRNQSEQLKLILSKGTRVLSELVNDYELIVIDNASEDSSVSNLKSLTGSDGLPNLQVYALTKEVNRNTAFWVGVENSLGDLVATIDPMTDDLSFLPRLLEKASEGLDVVFALNQSRPKRSFGYRMGLWLFNLAYRWLSGIDLTKDASSYRLVTRRVVNFILQHPHPEITYRHLPATGGFAKANLEYSSPFHMSRHETIVDALDRGMRLIVSTTRVPMRLVTGLSMFGAISNLLYSIYIILVAILKSNVAPGWTTLSLQLSGMFCLVSLVLMVLGEYILHSASLSNEGPTYHVAQEFTSATITRRERLNVEVTRATEHERINSNVESPTFIASGDPASCTMQL